MRHQHDYFPGNVRPNIPYLKEVLQNKYNSVVNDVDHKIDEETWGNFIQLNLINAWNKNGKKNYIEFTFPTCPNYNVLVYNHELNDEHALFFQCIAITCTTMFVIISTI